jgi:hypothetical protein
LAFVDFHRFTAINYKLPLLDTLVACHSCRGAAVAIPLASRQRETANTVVKQRILRAAATSPPNRD